MYFLFYGFIVLLPLLVGISILIERDNESPIFYLGIRTGKFGELFKMLKFKTMVVDTEKIGVLQLLMTTEIAKIRKYLRKYKMDKIQQLINAL